ncbi:MAG: hypothetical protein ACTHLE_15395 [Agriterribacter sp.]
MKYKVNVVDFYVEKHNVGRTDSDSCWSITIYFTFETTNIEQMELSELDYFSILVGTPSGIKIYFEKIFSEGNENLFFYPHIACIKEFDKEAVLAVLRQKIENFYGKNKNEIIGKGLVFFDWQFQDDPIEFSNLFV